MLSSGIRLDHDEFEGRARNLPDFRPVGDQDGSGTALASVIGGRTVGVAKSVRLYSVNIAPSGETNDR